MIFHTARFFLSFDSLLSTVVFPDKKKCSSPYSSLLFASRCRRNDVVTVDYTFSLINIACALCANEDDAAAFPRKSARRICARDPRRYTCTAVRAYAAGSWPRQTHSRANAIRLCRRSSLQRAPRPLLHAGLAATPSIRAPQSAATSFSNDGGGGGGVHAITGR